MMNNCIGCFANNSDDGEGCGALSERIEKKCPFYKTSEQYERDQRIAEARLLIRTPRQYDHYHKKGAKKDD